MNGIPTENRFEDRPQLSWKRIAASRWGRIFGLHLVDPASVPAWIASLTLHCLLLIVLLLARYAAAREQEAVKFQSTQVFDTELPEMERLELENLGNSPDPTESENLPGSVAQRLSSAIVDSPQIDQFENLAVNDIASPSSMILPESVKIDSVVSIRGAGPEVVGGVEGAVDRLAVEIHNRLKDGPTLVVWLADASASLNSERQKLASHIRSIYGHLDQLDTEKRAGDGALMASVIGFGERLEPMSDKPLTDPAMIAEAILNVRVDLTGIENTFQAVIAASRKYANFKQDKTPCQVIIVVLTDEVGDDESNLEDAIAVTRRNSTPVFVLGSPALFGQVIGHMDFRDPETGEVQYGLEVRQGPESARLEQIQIPFWYPNQNPGQPMSSGFGPFALSRLAAQSGGIYFISRDLDGWRQFRGEHLREFRPDLASLAEYDRLMDKSPIRRALVRASTETSRTVREAPGLFFPPVEDANFELSISDQQARAAQWGYVVDRAIAHISDAAPARDREPSRRWRAHYDLMRGRLLALKVRSLEYNNICAKLRREKPKFANAQSNAWRLEPSNEIVTSDSNKTMAAEATEILKKIVAEYPQTPWADLATRELAAPFGFRWAELYIPPARPAPAGNAAPPRPPARPARPPIKL
jgi:hypothetical protein